ncbi:ABC transporter substrate-binding protein [Butyrivibrio sp. MC2013]|uniref:ABC transporter substrate-binding protein n=1 Tax=Butyrivibrio sp. MC2013 TaxID=1280686 RepID=UPI0004162243|nr:ABC transporter substrate-binding protein [Butyrivibrio sp. MC2013]
MKKKILSLVLVTALTMGLMACGSVKGANRDGADDSQYVLKIGETQGALCHAPLQVAMEKGFLDEEGVKWERVDFGSGDIQAALGAGTIDCGFGLVGKFIQPIENGLNMVITAGMHTGCTKILTRKDSGIESIEDLRGKTIAVSSLAGSEAVTCRRALYAAGVDISAASGEIEFAVYSGTDQPVALMNGAVDAIATADPVATNAQNEYDLRVLLDTAATEPYADEYCCVSFVSRELVENHPDVAAAFTRAMLKASAWVSENIEETAQIQVDAEYVSGDPAANAQILSTYLFVPSVQGGYDALKNVTYDLKKIELLKESTDPDELIESSFKFFDGVPDSYEIIDGQFKEVN